MKWQRKKGTFKTRIGTSFEETKFQDAEGTYYVKFPFIIHRSLHSQKYWVVAHLASGCSVGPNVKLLKDAKAMGDELHSHPCFQLPSPTLLMEQARKDGSITEIQQTINKYTSMH
jgi:hypothetical protein